MAQIVPMEDFEFLKRELKKYQVEIFQKGAESTISIRGMDQAMKVI